MKVITIEEAKNIDKKTTEKIPSVLLMEHVASEIFYLLIKRHRIALENKVVHIFSSVGGNGGDGFAVARYLIKNGFDVRVYISGNLDRVNKDTYANFNILKSMNIDIVYLIDEDKVLEVIENINDGDIVIDSLFGIGGNRALIGIEKLLVDKLNNIKNILKIAIDMPSGLISKIENNNNSCFIADETYTICFAKDIFFLENTKKFIGKLFIIKSIFPNAILNDASYKAFLLNHREKINIYRDAFFSKREQGSLSIVAGSASYVGASILVTKAAYRCGVGYIRLYVPKGILNIVRNTIMFTMPEVVLIGVGEENQAFFTENDIDIVRDINKSSACIIGSGIGREVATEIFVNSLIKQITVPTVIDADAIYLMFQSTLEDLSSNFILTPHIYEFEKISSINHKEILHNPYEALSYFRTITKATILLKDAISFVMKDDTLYINYNPTYSMGKAGMGDVLAGLISSFIARDMDILEAIKLSLIIQAKAFKKLSKLMGNDSVQPKDITNIVSKILKRIK